jgi:hypothetical protein
MKYLASLLLALAACGGPQTGSGSKPTSGLSKDEAVLEAVFLHEIAADTPAAGETICLTVRGGLTEPVLAAIQKRHPTAVDDKECSGGGMDSRVTKIGGGDAVRFDIGPVEWIGDEARCKGGGGHRQGGAHEVEYTVKLTDGAWKITGEKPGLMM